MGRGLLVALLVGLTVWLLLIGVLLALGRKEQARALATLIPNLVVLFRGLLGDPRVPRSSKAWLWFALAWILSPVDLIPEFIPVLGPLDDALVAPSFSAMCCAARTDPSCLTTGVATLRSSTPSHGTAEILPPTSATLAAWSRWETPSTTSRDARDSRASCASTARARSSSRRRTDSPIAATRSRTRIDTQFGSRAARRA